MGGGSPGWLPRLKAGLRLGCDVFVSGLTDREVAAAAAEAAASLALARRGDPGRVVAKDAPTDVASEADRAAEAAAVAVISAARPEDGYLGEEGAERAAGARTWVVDALDGTLNYLYGLNGWCAAVALEDEHGPLAAAVCDPVREELFTAARGEGATRNREPLRLAGAGDSRRTLDHALIATFLHQPKRALPGVTEVLGRVLQGAGSVRITGSGTLELAYVAAGRLDGWIQPATYRWDWVPGALLVTEAGGLATRTLTDPDWCIAATSRPLHDALAALTR
jgi:myo-inositol-1(or 4)-monophosphatase